MKNLRWLAILMGVTIFAITGFQAYWLKKNYDREERSLEIKTNVAFRRTIQQLQVSKLKLDKEDSIRSMMFIDPTNQRKSKRTRMPKEGMVEMISILKEKIKDSIFIKGDKDNDSLIIFQPPGFEKRIYYSQDSIKGKEVRADRLFQFLYGVDSLQDSIRIHEIIPAYKEALKKENAEVPFSIYRLPAPTESDEPVFNEMTVGFVHPVTYKVELGNTFSYMLQRLASPILLSLFLVGVTILSFVLLYRNLLKQRRLAAIKNEFISNITHELKTPIATVGVAIEALRNFNAISDPQRTKEYLDISSNELQRLSLLVDKVLKLSMFENQEVELKYETLDLKDIVNEVVSSMRLQFEKYGAKISVNTQGSTYINADRLHLLSVVYNLLDNSLKYSKGVPEINVELTGQDDSVMMTVTDNGIGIEPEYKDKIFEKFFRVPTGNTHNAKGYGLGLSYTAHVVHKHKGSIQVDSKPGSGSTFTIVFPKQAA